VSVFIAHPLATRASVGSFQPISFCPSCGAVPAPFARFGSSLPMSKLLPGSMPIFFICAMIGSSVTCGG